MCTGADSRDMYDSDSVKKKRFEVCEHAPSPVAPVAPVAPYGVWLHVCTGFPVSPVRDSRGISRADTSGTPSLTDLPNLHRTE